MTRMTMSAALAAAIFTAAGAANAFTIDSSNYDVCLGSSFCEIGAAKLHAKNGVFREQTFPKGNPLEGLGVDSGTAGGNRPELQGNRMETIEMEFGDFAGGGLALQEIRIGHLYNDAEFGNDPDEIAYIDAFFVDGGRANLKIQSFDNSDIGFEFNDVAPTGTPFTVSDANAKVERLSTERGEFLLTDLFGGKLVHTLVFSADAGFGTKPNGQPSNDASDYSVTVVAAIPVPAPFALLLAGLGGLGFLSWRRRAAA